MLYYFFSTIRFLNNFVSRISRNLALFIISFYKVYLTPIFSGQCKFYPTCSCYGEEAFKKLPAYKAFWLVSKRICKCHPFRKFSYDPVPEEMLK